MEAVISDALRLAHAQLGRLQGGDFDGYAAGEADYARACAAVSALAEGGGPLDAAGMGDLVRLAASISGELNRLAGDAAERLAALARSRAAAGAYLQAPPPLAFRTREA